MRDSSQNLEAVLSIEITSLLPNLSFYPCNSLLQECLYFHFMPETHIWKSSLDRNETTWGGGWWCLESSQHQAVCFLSILLHVRPQLLQRGLPILDYALPWTATALLSVSIKQPRESFRLSPHLPSAKISLAHFFSYRNLGKVPATISSAEEHKCCGLAKLGVPVADMGSHCAARAGQLLGATKVSQTVGATNLWVTSWES